MKSNAEQGQKSRLQLKKRISSANFTTKKLKSILTTRQTYDQTMIKHTNTQSNANTTTSKNLHQKPNNKNNLITYHKSDHINNPSTKILMQMLKNCKYQKTKQQTALMKNCDKTKLIYWNTELILKGNQKYLILSADLILNQDCFWDKTNSDNGKFYPNTNYINNTLSTLSYNATSTLRSRNINSYQYQAKLGSSTSIGTNIPNSKKNPLMNPSTVSSFVREWKYLHSKTDSNNNRLVIVWVVRKQSSYNHIMELVNFYQLPIHAIFYTKRKRNNYFFDLNPIVKQIYNKFFQSVIHPRKQNCESQISKTNQKHNDLKKSKSKQFPRQDKHLQKTISQQLKKQFGSITNRIGITRRQPASNLQNDENSMNLINSTKPKEFQLSKNNYIRNTTVNQNQNKQFTIKMRKVHPSSANKIRSTTIKIGNFLKQNQQTCREKIVNADVFPVLKKQNYQHKQTQQTSNEIQFLQLQNIGFNTQRYVKPQIFIFEGIKCNEKDFSTSETYFGKIPLLFNHHNQKFLINKKKVEQQLKINIYDDINHEISTFYINYESLSQNVLEKLNSAIKQKLRNNNSSKGQQSYCYKLNKINQFTKNMIALTLQQVLPTLQLKQKEKQSLHNNQTKQAKQQIQLTQQQQQIIIEKTQKKLDQIRKKMIDDVIKVKGRNYTFENGESIYYYVGDIFKRNYNFFYEDYYKQYEKELINEMNGNSIKKKQKEKGPAMMKDTSRKQLSRKDTTQSNLPQKKQTQKLCYQFYESNINLGNCLFYELK